MSDKFRPLQAAEEAVEKATDKAQGRLLDWLDHKECDNCGSLCTAETEYVERQAAITEVWVCAECESRFYREEESPYSFDMWR